MGLFDSLFGNKDTTAKTEKESLPWIPLTSLEQLDDIALKSNSKTQIIFKHSTTCGISRMVMNTFKGTYKFTKDQADLYYLDLHSFRAVSNEVGAKFNVVHQSPQLLVIRNGMAVANASHGSINDMNLDTYV